MRETPYPVYFQVINPNDIWNFLAPPMEKVLANPVLKEKLDEVESDVLENGFRNPISVSLTRVIGERGANNHTPCAARHGATLYLPSDDIHLVEAGELPFLICRIRGGTRLRVAQKHNIPIPCLVSDLIHAVVNREELKQFEIMEKFTDKPDRLNYHAFGLEPVYNPKPRVEFEL